MKIRRLLLLLWLGALTAVALTACSTPLQVPKETKVEVPVACLKPADKPVRPYLRSDEDLMAMDRFRRTLAVVSEWLKLTVYAAELEAIVEGCSRLPTR